MVSVVTTFFRALLIGLIVAIGGCESPDTKPLKYITDPADTATAADTADQDTGSRDTADRDTGRYDTGGQDTGGQDTGGQDTGAEDTGGSDSCAAPLVLVGSQFLGPASPWSDELLETLICRGPVTDGTVLRVGIFAEAERSGPSASVLTDLQAALLSRGADDVQILVVGSSADAAALVDDMDTLDAAVLAPTSAGDAYDAWNDTALEDALQRLRDERGGGIAGLGPGAMLLAGSSLAGGQDYLSTHVMIDAMTTELDDLSDGGSALHDDFLPWVPNATIDVQMTGLGRLVRLAGALARRADEAPESPVWGVGMDASSGLIIQDNIATVVGPGTVSLVRPTDESVLTRAHWTPLTWTHLRLDRLTSGWRFDLVTAEVDTSTTPDGAEPVDWTDTTPTSPAEDWHLSGHISEEEAGFGTVVQRSASTFETSTGTAEVIMPGLLGMLDADFYEDQAINHEALYRALYDHIGHTGVLVTYQGRLEHAGSAPGMLRFSWNTPVPSRDDPEMLLERWEPSHVVVDTHAVSWRSLADTASPYSTAINPAGLIGMTLHLLAGSDSDGWVYDLAAHAPARP